MKVPYTNETTKFMHVGGVTIPPGATRDVDASLLPGPKPQAEEPAKPVMPDAIAELLKKKVGDVTAALAGLSDDDLAKAGEQEQAGRNRKSVVEAIAAEQLRRAQVKAGGEGQ